MAEIQTEQEAEIYRTLTTIFRDTFADDSIVLRPDLSAADVTDWDSARMIELIVAAEERFGIRFSSREVDRLRNVGDFIRTISEKQTS